MKNPTIYFWLTFFAYTVTVISTAPLQSQFTPWIIFCFVVTSILFIIPAIMMFVNPVEEDEIQDMPTEDSDNRYWTIWDGFGTPYVLTQLGSKGVHVRKRGEASYTTEQLTWEALIEKFPDSADVLIAIKGIREQERLANNANIVEALRSREVK